MPFPRAKGTAYDAGIRTPLLFSWPAEIAAGTTYEGLVSVIDLASELEIATVPVGAKPQGLAVTSDSRKVYVTHLTGAQVTVIDAVTRAYEQE